MAFTLTWESTDITSEVINYKRTASICEGTRTITVQLTDTGRAYTTWERFIVSEDGNSAGKYFIKDINRSHDGTVNISAQDSSLKLERYFEHKIWTPKSVTTARYWIELWLDRAGVSYNFNTTSYGAVINSKNSSFGRDTTYNLIIPMLQKSGWYAIFDFNDVLQIGKLDVDTKSVSYKYYETDILEISYLKSDKNARNRVVVWGGVDSVTGTWITGEASVDADWQINNKDIRSTVVSSNAIKNYASAYTTANNLLDKVQKLGKEKTLAVAGFIAADVGDLVYVETRVFTGTGLITDIEANFNSSSGYKTTITLDRQCPRLFAYFSWDGYVYVGTDGGGIYRKPFETSTFSSYNSGLDNLNILDLYIDNGLMITVTGSGYAYVSTVAWGYWRKLEHGEFEDLSGNTYSETDVEAVACTIDDKGTIIIGYNHKEQDYSWLLHYDISSGFIRKDQVVIDGNEGYPISDLDNNGDTTVIGIEGQGLVNVEEIYVDGLTICRNVWTEFSTATYDRRPVAKASVNNYNTTITLDNQNTLIGQSVVFNKKYSYYGSTGTGYRQSGVTRYDIDAEIGNEVQLPVSNDCYYGTLSIIDEDTAIHVVESSGLKVYSVDFSSSSANLLSSPGGVTQPPLQTHSFTDGHVLLVWNSGGTTRGVVLTKTTASSSFEILTASFNSMTNTTGARLTPYELSNDRVGVIGADDEKLYGNIVTSTGSTGSEETYQVVTNYPDDSFQVRQFCPNSDYSSIYVLVWKVLDQGTYNDMYLDIVKFDGSFSLVQSTLIGSNKVWDTHYTAKLSAWKEGMYLIETDIGAGTTSSSLLEGIGYSIKSTVQHNDRISPRSDDHDGAFVIFDRGKKELQRHRGSSVTVLKTGVNDTGFIWLAGSSILTESQRLYSSLSGTILISGTTGSIVRNDYFDLPVTTSGNFTIVLEGIQGSAKIESSRTVPVFAFTEKATAKSEAYTSFTLQSGSWNILTSDKKIPISDSRIIYNKNSEGLLDGFQVSVASDDENLRVVDSKLSEDFSIIYSGTIATSGNNPLYRMETSNGIDPYMFVSTSGAPSQFFQKDQQENSFTEYSNGLPNNNITIIRVDDIIA